MRRDGKWQQAPEFSKYGDRFAFWRRALVAGLIVVTLIGPATRPAADEPSLLGSLRHHRTEPGDTLVDLACHYALGYSELVAANPGIDPWVPKVGIDLVLPTAYLLPAAPRRGIVINLAEQRLYHFPPPPGKPRSYPVGIGREGWETPLGRTQVVGKRAQPSWRPPASIRLEQPGLPELVAPGPHNPLGDFALDLGWTGYVIHGTNRPAGIGRRVSHGCIRLYNADVEKLFAGVPVGTEVLIVDQPLKVGWSAGSLYLEAHPGEIERQRPDANAPVPLGAAIHVLALVLDAAGEAAHRLNWSLIYQTLSERRGIPVRVTE